MSKESKCERCGEPMPEGETMFKFHGYSGPCPKPPLKKEKQAQLITDEQIEAVFEKVASLHAIPVNGSSVVFSTLVGIDQAKEFARAIEEIIKGATEPQMTKPKTYSRCSNTLRLLGKPYPRTCQECGLGPCKDPIKGATE